MRIEDFKNPNGKFVPVEYEGIKTHAFVPALLPPKIEWDEKLVSSISRASVALGRLDGYVSNLPNPKIIISPLLRREAVLSSRIEGTKATLDNLFLYEATKTEQTNDVKEVYNYLKSFEYAIAELEKLPVCLRMIKSIHRILLSGVRGKNRAPGDFRKIRVVIGSSKNIDDISYIPPPPQYLINLLDNLEKFIQSDDFTPILQAAILHYQFEAIHPFLDGNGRVGRVLIPILLMSKNIIKNPILHISAYFESHRREYYDYLLDVSRKGDWHNWIDFFLEAIISTTERESEITHKLVELRENWRKNLADKITPTAMKVLELFFNRNRLTAKIVEKESNISRRGALKTLKKLEENDIAKSFLEKREKIFYCPRISKILS